MFCSFLKGQAPIFRVPVSIELISRVDAVLGKMMSNNTRAGPVGFYGWNGMGGIGKTTLAEAVYNTLVASFKTGFHAFVSFQLIPGPGGEDRDTIGQLGGILKQLGEEPVSNILNVILRQLKVCVGGKRVLLLFDNVISRKQVDALLECCEGVASGSRILFTCRDADILPKDTVSKVMVNGLSDESGFELVCQKAKLDIELLITVRNLKAGIMNAVRACAGLPLALDTIGAFMRNKSTNLHFWKVCHPHTTFNCKSFII